MLDVREIAAASRAQSQRHFISAMEQDDLCCRCHCKRQFKSFVQIQISADALPMHVPYKLHELLKYSSGSSTTQQYTGKKHC